MGERAQAPLGASSKWFRPFLPIESEQKHKWMDESLKQKHPLLAEEANFEDALEPPIEMLPIWTPTERWQIVLSDDTDEDGWQYGMSWHGSSWSRAPRPVLDAVRKRQWQRTYKLGAPDMQWASSALWARSSVHRAPCCGRACDACCRRCFPCFRPAATIVENSFA